MPNRPTPDPNPTPPTSGGAAHDVEGGDAACWLPQVCPDCGALNETPAAPCWRCGVTRSPGDA